MELETKRTGERQVQIMNEIDFVALNIMHKTIISKQKTMNTKRDKVKNPGQAKKLEELKKQLENDKKYEIEPA